jgi:hypothetical protein
MKRTVLSLLLLVGVCASPNVAQAQSSAVWSVDAMTCVQAGAPIVPGLYDALAGGVRIAQGKRANIALICAISQRFDLRTRRLRLTYRDGDGPWGPAQVTAVLRRVRKSSGAVASLTTSQIRSNTSSAPISGATGWATHRSSLINHVMDTVNYYYYVQINLSRIDTFTPVAAMGVQLTN